jgi:hypothetical protein
MQELSTSGKSHASLQHLVILSSYVQSHPAPVYYSANAVKHTPPLNSTQHMHSTWQAARTLAMRTLLHACPQLCSSHAANACLPLDVSRAAALTPHLHQAVAALARTPTPASFRAYICLFVGICQPASEHFAHKHCCTQTTCNSGTFTCILDRVTHILFLHQ